MKRYIGVKVVNAAPGLAPSDMGVHKEGEEGYTVQYQDGYTSWSPKKVFEEAYRECDAMPFGLALEALKKGHKVRRTVWDEEDRGIKLAKEKPNHLEIQAPYIYKIVTIGTIIQWRPNLADLLSEDWVIVVDDKE